MFPNTAIAPVAAVESITSNSAYLLRGFKRILSMSAGFFPWLLQILCPFCNPGEVAVQPVALLVGHILAEA
jgi:hypothetical protein